MRDKIYAAKNEGYSDDDIINYLSQTEYADQVNSARAEGYSNDEIVNFLGGEEQGFFNRLKQGAADFYLSTGQMANYLGQKTGLGDVQFTSEGINYVSPEELADQQPIIQDAIKLNNMAKGDPGLAADFAIAAGNPATWMAALGPGGAAIQGMKGGLGLEFATPQEGDFDPTQKAVDTGIAGTAGAAFGKGMDIAVPAIAKGVTGAAKNIGIVPKKVIGGAVAPFSTKMAQPRATKELTKLVPDTETAVKNIDREFISDLTPAQKSGSEDLMSLQNTIADKSPAQRLKLEDQANKVREQLSGELEGIGGGNVANTREFIDTRRANTLDKLKGRANIAQGEAVDATANVLPTKRPSEASVQVSEELGDSLRKAKGRERNLWLRVPDDVVVETNNSAKMFNDIKSNTPSAQIDDIPSFSEDILSGQNTIKELQGLRSKLLEDSRIARAAGNYNKSRLADDLADAVLEDMGAQADNIQGEAGDSLRRALDFSREVAQKFKQGSVGKVMGSDKTGGSKIAPELILDRTIGSGSTKGGVAASELEDAAPTDNLREGISQYVMNNFKNKAYKGDKVDPAAAEKFIRDNVDILDRLPDLKSNIEKAASLQSSATSKTAKLENVKKKLFSKQQSKTAEFLDAPVGKEFDRILNSKNPGGLTAQLRRTVAKDRTGEALKGLKTAAIDHLVTKSGMSGKKMTSMLNDKKMTSVLDQLLDSQERKRLSMIAEELRLVDGTSMKQSSVISDPPGRLLSMVVTTLGARAGAQLGAGTSGASLKTASAGSKLFNDILNNLTTDKAEVLLNKAVFDDELMKILLMDGGPKGNTKMVERRLSNWLKNNTGFADVLLGAKAGQEGVDLYREDQED